MLHYLFLGLLLLSSCSDEQNDTIDKNKVNQNKNDYWYNGKAEISSYELNQARYGEIREGKAVLIFVTEPFSPTKMVKADNPSQKDVSVLKLNFTKKFNTGIYPYSMMTSTFLPFKEETHSLKISSSSQEWCGNTYMELENKKQFEIDVISYFEGESKKDILLNKDYLEDDFFTIIRLRPNILPIGETTIIPSFFYLRLEHQTTKAYRANTSSSKINETTTNYIIYYPDLDRTLSINYETCFPYKILSWKETYYSGWGENRKKLSTTAKLIKTIKSDYWNQNSNSNLELRKELGLE